jgi:hypothetical protein
LGHHYWTVFYEFLKCGLYNTYNTCIILFVWYSEQMWAVFTTRGASRNVGCIIRIIQPTFQKTQFNKRSYNTRSCIIVHMAVYYTLYYTYGSVLLYTWKVAISIIRCIIQVYYTHVLYIRFTNPDLYSFRVWNHGKLHQTKHPARGKIRNKERGPKSEPKEWNPKWATSYLMVTHSSTFVHFFVFLSHYQESRPMLHTYGT